MAFRRGRPLSCLSQPICAPKGTMTLFCEFVIYETCLSEAVMLCQDDQY
eukprot:UN22570